MPDLSFQIGEIAAMKSAAVPTIVAPLEITNTLSDEPIRSIGLNCQVRIHPFGRSYSILEETRLLELFGERERWARSMTPLVWTHLSISVPAFTGRTVLDLPLPCSMDFDVAANKYFNGLRAGNIRGSALFSGTIFYTTEAGALQIGQIPWDREARFSVPVSVWQETIKVHYGNSAWLRLSRETLERLYRCRLARGFQGWDRLLNRLIDDAERNEMQECAPLPERATP